MRQDIDTGDRTVSLPDGWSGTVAIEEQSEDVLTVRRVGEDGSIPPLSILATHRPILVDVHFARSGIVANPIDAVRFGYRESEFRAEFYYLDILEEPQWVQITEDTDDPHVGMYPFVDKWVEQGELTAAEAKWAKDQFE